MSHFTRVQTVIRDEHCLVGALAQVGFAHVERHQHAQHLYGYQGDQREQTAEVIIRRQYIGSLSNDIGFKRGQDDSFSAIISGFDRHRYGDTWLNNLHREYARLMVKQQAKEQGYILEKEEVLPTGEVELVLSQVL